MWPGGIKIRSKTARDLERKHASQSGSDDLAQNNDVPKDVTRAEQRQQDSGSFDAYLCEPLDRRSAQRIVDAPKTGQQHVNKNCEEKCEVGTRRWVVQTETHTPFIRPGSREKRSSDAVCYGGAPVREIGLLQLDHLRVSLVGVVFEAEHVQCAVHGEVSDLFVDRSGRFGRLVAGPIDRDVDLTE